MIDYDILIERCKRYDTKQEIVQCLDKAYTTHQEQMIKRRHDADFFAGCSFGVFLFFVLMAIGFVVWHDRRMGK